MPYLVYEQQSGYLLPPHLEELIPADHVARVVNEIVDLLDISELTSRVKVEGRPAYHPRMMLKLLFYAYSQKVRSSREIARRCGEDVVFMWLAGRQRPDFRTISDFRKDNIEVIRSPKSSGRSRALSPKSTMPSPSKITRLQDCMQQPYPL